LKCFWNLSEDEEVIQGLTALLKKRKIEIYTKTTVKEAKVKKGRSEVVAIDKEGKEFLFNAEKTLVAVGRSPYTQGLGLDKIQIAMNAKFIKVNEKMRQYSGITPSVT
jgi:dihydrolipoamide dehydrogenase